MNRFAAILLGCMFVSQWMCAQEQTPATSPARFIAVEVFVDSGAQPLAAYQLEFSATNGSVKIVGIEGGGHPAFKEPPHYDAKAMQNDRAVLAAFNTAPSGQLPSGKTRVAIIHVQVSGERAPIFTVKLQAAADSEGRPISVQTSVNKKDAK